MPRQKKEKPITEVQLDALQEDFLKDPNNEKVKTEFFFLLKSYSRSLTLKEIKNKIFLDPDRVDEVATEATLRFLNQYKKDGWKVWGSFAGALRWKVVEALYQDANEESAQSLNALIGDATSGHEMGDFLDKLKAEPVFESSKSIDPQIALVSLTENPMWEIRDILREASEILPYRTVYLFYIYLLQILRRPKSRLRHPTFKELFLSKKEEEQFDLLLLEVRTRLMGQV